MESQTKKLLADAFEELLNEKPLERITVADIVKRCGAARSTFYNHFSDKYEIMIWRYESILDELTEIKPGAYYKNTLEGDRYLAKNRKYFLKILDYKGQNSVYEFLYKFTMETLTNLVKQKAGTEEIPKHEYEMLRFFGMGCVHYTLDWVRTMHESPEEIAQAITQSVPPALLKYLE